jgi:hypothetical protein
MAFLSARGSISNSVSVPAGQYCLIAICPENNTPVIAEFGDPASQVSTMYDVTGYQYNDGNTGTTDFWVAVGEGTDKTHIEFPWTGSSDPRTLVSGYTGPSALEYDSRFSPNISLQQLMGGRFCCELEVPYGGAAIIRVGDSISFPAGYGPKLQAYSPDEYVGNAMYPGVLYRHFTSPALYNHFPMSQFAEVFRTKYITGGSSGAKASLCGALCPNQGWVPWTGNYTGLNNQGNSSIGGVPYHNMLAALNSGQGFVFVNNTGSLPVNITVNLDVTYNVSVLENSTLTIGPSSVVTPNPAAMMGNMIAIAEQFSSPSTQLGFVWSLCDNERAAWDCFREGTTVANIQRNRVDLRHLMPVQPKAPAIQTAQVAPTAPNSTSFFGRVFDGVASLAKSVAPTVEKGLSRLAEAGLDKLMTMLI